MAQQDAGPKNRYSVILPTYNERDNLPLIIWLLVKTFTDHDIDYDVLIVEDNSPDGTPQVAMQLQAIYGNDRIRILARAGKLGLGSAYTDGLKVVTGTHVILMDADLSHHPNFIPALIAKQQQGNYDVVTGTRYAMGGGVSTHIYHITLTISKQRFPSIAERTGYVFQMEVIVRCKALGYSVGEVPITFVDRIYGVSKLGAMEVVSYLKGLIWLFFDT
eukprot:12590-Heterococcus_DN1.PRE.4